MGLNRIDEWLTRGHDAGWSNHKDECNCDNCHEGHKYHDLVFENATECPEDYDCCVEEYNKRKREGWYDD